jgi:ketosteroid isomerase-like protein
VRVTIASNWRVVNPRPSAISHDNVDVILRGIDASNRRDADAFVACLHPDVEWEESGQAFPGLRGIYRGWAEVRGWFEEAFGSLWATSHTDVEEIIEASDDRLLLRFRRIARGRASGVETAMRGWNVFWLANGKIARREGPFSDRAEALQAVGLAPLDRR